MESKTDPFSDELKACRLELAFEQKQAERNWCVGFCVGAFIFGAIGLFVGWFVAVLTH